MYTESFRPPRSGLQLVDAARGARNCVPPKVKVAREEPLRPLPRSAHLCPPHFLLLEYTPRVPTLLTSRPKKPKARRGRRPGHLHHRGCRCQKPRTHLASVPRSRSTSRARRLSFSQGNGVAAPTTACCCHVLFLRRFWLLRVPASRPQIVSLFVNAAVIIARRDSTSLALSVRTECPP